MSCPVCGFDRLAGTEITVVAKFPKTTWTRKLSVVSDKGSVGLDGRHWIKIRRESSNTYDNNPPSVWEASVPCESIKDELGIYWDSSVELRREQ